MTPQTPNQLMLAWRAEIASELDEARKALAAAEEEYSAAATAAQVAAAGHAELRSTLQSISIRRAGFASMPLAEPLVHRLDEHKRAAGAADGANARANGARQALIRQVSELEQALDQIDQISPADEEVA